MNTTFQVIKGSEIVASVAKAEDGSHWTLIRAMLADDSTLEVTPVVAYTPCSEHPSFELGNCPRCGH